MFHKNNHHDIQSAVVAVANLHVPASAQNLLNIAKRLEVQFVSKYLLNVCSNFLCCEYA